MTVKKIGIISIYPFPMGGSASNRIFAYAKGLVSAGAEVIVYIPGPTERRDKNSISDNIKSGTVEGVRFVHCSGKFRHDNRLISAFAKLSGLRVLLGVINFYRSVKRENRKGKIDCFIISTDLIKLLFCYGRIAKRTKAKSIFIFDEYPIPIRHKLKKDIPRWKKMGYTFVLKRCIDSYISISADLVDYYSGFSKKPSYVLSVITDTDRFGKASISEDKGKYLCYMGNMELTKDNVDIIIKAFAKLGTEFSELKLRLYGPHREDSYPILIKLVKELGIQDRVEFPGFAGPTEVPIILVNAKILLNSQPDTLRAKGGFPTKLGEYLSTGVPVILTNVGENAKYVNHGEHVYFVHPNDPDDYYKKLEYVLNNYPEALNVAENGKKLLLNTYSHHNQGKKLLIFLDSLYAK